MFSHLIFTSFLLLSTTTSTTTAVTTLFAGDSDIEYWSTDSVFPDSVNKGRGGWTCKQVGNKIGDHLDRYEPEWVVLVCGENDLWSQSATQTFNDFMEVVDEIIETGARVVYMGTKPEPSTGFLHSKYRSYDAKIRAKAIEMEANTASPNQPPPLVMVDVYPIFDAIEDSNPGLLYRNDRLHLNNAGYSYWNTWAQTALADDIGSCIRWEDNVCEEESTGGSPTCVDSALPISFRRNEVSCTEVAEADACSNSVAASHCPATCSTCGEYECEDTQALWVINGSTVDCDDVSNLDPVTLSRACGIASVASTCRGTCQYCL